MSSFLPLLLLLIFPILCRSETDPSLTLIPIFGAVFGNLVPIIAGIVITIGIVLLAVYVCKCCKPGGCCRKGGCCACCCEENEKKWAKKERKKQEALGAAYTHTHVQQVPMAATPLVMTADGMMVPVQGSPGMVVASPTTQMVQPQQFIQQQPMPVGMMPQGVQPHQGGMVMMGQGQPQGMGMVPQGMVPQGGVMYQQQQQPPPVDYGMMPSQQPMYNPHAQQPGSGMK